MYYRDSEYLFAHKGRMLYYLAQCAIHFLRYGRAVQPLNDVRTVLVVQGAQIGDMVCTTPVFRAIKRAYPNCRLVVVGSEINKTTLEGNPDVDEYVLWTERVEELIPRIRAMRPDYGCTMSPNFPALALMYLAGIPTIAVPKVVGGWSPYETKPYRLTRHIAHVVEHRMGHYVPREYLRMLEPLGIHAVDTIKYVYATPRAWKAAKERLEGTGVAVALFPSAGNPVKRWPPERFAEVADYLIDTYGVTIYICGTNTTEYEAEIICSTVKRKDKVRNLTGLQDLDETKAFMGVVDLVVAVDTGPIFFAEAHGTATVDIVGPVDEREQPPNDGVRHRVVLDPNRGEPELHCMNARKIDVERATEQIQAVTVTMVTDVLDQVMSVVNV